MSNEKKQNDEKSNAPEQNPVNDFDLGFRSRSHSQSQMSKSEVKESENNDYVDNKRQKQVDYGSRPIFGF